MTGRPTLYKALKMFYVYYLRLKPFPDKAYIGFTQNLRQRLADHDAGKSVYTKDF